MINLLATYSLVLLRLQPHTLLIFLSQILCDAMPWQMDFSVFDYRNFANLSSFFFEEKEKKAKSLFGTIPFFLSFSKHKIECACDGVLLTMFTSVGLFGIKNRNLVMTFCVFL